MTYHRDRSMTALVFGALLTTITYSAAHSQETLVLQEGDVQKAFLEALGIEISPSSQEPMTREEQCRSLALKIFQYRDSLHNRSEMVEVADLIDQAAQLNVTTAIYLDLDCSGKRLLPQDVYVQDEDKSYYVGRRSR